MSKLSDQCADAVLEAAPKIMQSIRREMRRGRNAASLRTHRGELTIPQFRTLIFFHHHPGADLSSAAEFIGLALPSMSKQVDQLTQRGYLRRTVRPADRRRLAIALTAAGEERLAAARRLALAALSRRLERMDPAALEDVARSLTLLMGALAEDDLLEQAVAS